MGAGKSITRRRPVPWGPEAERGRGYAPARFIEGALRAIGDSMRTTNHLFIVWAMRRSGQHAVLHFLYRMYDPPKAFFNNRKAWRETFHTNKKDIADGDVSGDLELFMVNYEDHDVREGLAAPERLIQDYQEHVGRALDSRYLLVLRDPFNLFSSRLNHGEGRRIRRQIFENPERAITLWKNHAYEFTGRTKIFPDLVTVNYNRWVMDEDYRRDLAERCGRHYSSADWNLVTREGGGSTFDKRRIERADRMRLFERWKESRDEPAYRRLFQDRELVDLAHEIFGPIPGTEELLD
jgi:hypothetical protein